MVVRIVSRAGLAEFVAANHQIDSEGPCSRIVQYQRWWRGDVGEQIAIDCDAVSSLVALDARDRSIVDG